MVEYNDQLKVSDTFPRNLDNNLYYCIRKLKNRCETQN